MSRPDWEVQRGDGQLLRFANATGDTVTDVEFRLGGMAVGGKFGDRNWWQSVESMDAGEWIEAPFRAAWGAAQDPPRIVITWTAPDGQEWSETLYDLPL